MNEFKTGLLAVLVVAILASGRPHVDLRGTGSLGPASPVGAPTPCQQVGSSTCGDEWWPICPATASWPPSACLLMTPESWRIREGSPGSYDSLHSK